MSDSYFERSQRVKCELAADASFLDKVRDAFDGKIERFSFGTMVNLFRFGKQLDSGLFVALRAFQPEGHFGRGGLAVQTWDMEVYCKNAEYLDSIGAGVPRFCVGTVYKGKAGVLLEDITANGRYAVEHPSHQEDCVVIDGEKRRTVFIDIDASYRYFQGLADHKYFADGAVLDLERCAK